MIDIVLDSVTLTVGATTITLEKLNGGGVRFADQAGLVQSSNDPALERLFAIIKAASQA